MKFQIVLVTVFLSLVTQAWSPATFKKPSQKELKSRLTDLQFEVTQKDGTERPFKNEYWNNKREGLYVDIVSGEPLFSSLDMYDSGTGWPSFFKTIRPGVVKEKEDRSLFGVRTEVRSSLADSHLGHVFDDGPKPTGLRYCMNSAALKFIPLSDLEKEGYGEFVKDFKQSSLKKAIFAAGCFWCIEKDFELAKLSGIQSVVSGYTGGTKINPTYEEVSSGSTGHREVVEVTYDSSKTSYEMLLDLFWKNVDPYDSKGQFCDKGFQYTSAVYYNDETEKKAFESSRELLMKSGKLKGEVTVALEKSSLFYPAEEYHQDYYKKNPIRYKYYRSRCGRDNRLKEVWGK